MPEGKTKCRERVPNADTSQDCAGLTTENESAENSGENDVTSPIADDIVSEAESTEIEQTSVNAATAESPEEHDDSESAEKGADDADELTSVADQVVLTARGKEFKAIGKPTGDGEKFVVLAGSTINPTEAPSLPDSKKAKRQELQSLGVIVNFTFERNFVFDSSSEAAGVVTGRNVRAKDAWVRAPAD